MKRIVELIKVNKDARGCAQALLDAYQLQQWAAYALHKLGIDGRSAGILLEYVKLRALDSFREEPMRDSLRDQTLPFVAERILEHLKDKTEESKADQEQSA